VIDAVRVALTALRTREEPMLGDVHVVELEFAPGTFLAVDDRGRPHLLLRLADGDEPEMPESGVASLVIDTSTLVIGGRRTSLIDVTCLFESVAEVFDHFIVAVLERMDRDAPPTHALMDVLGRWKQFLIPAQGPPGRDKLAAVFGELVMLLDVVHADPARRIDPWVGPFGGRHDIRRATTALEIKTTRSHTSRSVTIHGEDQLEPPDAGTLHLHLVRLEEVPDSGGSVASLVDELLSVGVGAEALFEALSAAGIPLTDLSATADVTFQVRERLTIPIDDETPRIVPASFVGGARPVGVIEISYVIDLDHSLERALDERAFTSLVNELGRGV
jgi:hypothetical protein